MPKQELDAGELYNLALSIVGLVFKDGPATITELAEHFSVSEKAISKAINTIANSEDVANFKTHFYLNYDALEEGEVDFGLGEGNLEDAPVLSANQASALAMGLEFLSSLPEFNGNSDLIELKKYLSSSVVTTNSSLWNIGLEQLELIRSAILNQTRVDFDYVNQLGKHSRRQVDPLRIDLIGAKHYLRGYCLASQEVRSFRIDRITNLIATDLPISEEASISEIRDEIYGSGIGQQVEILAEFHAEEIFWNFPTASQPTQVKDKLSGVITVGNFEALARHIVRYGGAVQVIAPTEARVAVARFAEEALEQIEPEVE
jgi:proteasome accessory factor C